MGIKHPLRGGVPPPRGGYPPPRGGGFDDFGFPGRRKLEIVDFSRNLEKTPGNPRKTRILAGFPNTNSDFLAKTGGCTLPPPYRGGVPPP